MGGCGGERGPEDRAQNERATHERRPPPPSLTAPRPLSALSLPPRPLLPPQLEENEQHDAAAEPLLAAFDRFTAATDAALSDKRQIDELVTLFAYACRARLKPDGGVVVGQGAVKRFLTDILVADYPNGARRAMWGPPDVFEPVGDEAVGFRSLGFVVRTTLELLPTAGGEAAGKQQFNLDLRIKEGGVFGHEVTSVEVLERGGGATKQQKYVAVRAPRARERGARSRERRARRAGRAGGWGGREAAGDRPGV